MSGNEGAAAPDTGIIFYQTEDGKSRIQVRLQDGTVWLSQRLLAELYQVSHAHRSASISSTSTATMNSSQRQLSGNSG